MKANTGKRALTLLLLAVFITGSTLLLNGSITNAQALEDSKIITASASPSQSLVSSDTVSLAAESQDALHSANAESVKDAAATEQDAVPNFTINKNESNDVGNPGDKDLTINEAALACSKALRSFKNVDLTNGVMQMTFKQNGNGIIKRDMWEGYFLTSDGSGEYFVYVDSVTGEVYSLVECPQSNATSITSSDKSPFTDESFTAAACDFIKAKLSDKTITSAINEYTQGIVSHNTILKVTYVAVGLSDGTSYLLEVSDGTLDIWGFNYYPDGGAFSSHTVH